MVPNTRKELERLFFNILKQQVSDFPEGDVVEGESPDFVIRGLEGTLGVEVTRLFKRSGEGQQSLKAQESEKRMIVDMARKLHEKRGMPILHVSVLFGSSGPFNKSKRKLLSEQLANAIQACMPTPESWCRIDHTFEDDCPFPVEVASVRIANFSSLKRNHWSVGEAGWVQEDFVGELQKAIDEKHSELSEYLSRCSTCWLLIVADGSGPSSFFDPSDNTKRHTYSSRFPRTYFVEAFDGRIIQLSTVTNAAETKRRRD
jgi:hypothetical protein